MNSRSYRALRAVSFVAVLVGFMLFVFSQVVDVVPRRLEVRDRQHQFIGEVRIPHDYDSDTFTSFCFLVLSGLQFWIICLVGRNCKLRNNEDAEQKPIAAKAGS